MHKTAAYSVTIQLSGFLALRTHRTQFGETYWLDRKLFYSTGYLQNKARDPSEESVTWSALINKSIFVYLFVCFLGWEYNNYLFLTSKNKWTKRFYFSFKQISLECNIVRLLSMFKWSYWENNNKKNIVFAQVGFPLLKFDSNSVLEF